MTGCAGANVMATLTSPHPFSPARLAAARAAPDPRLAGLPAAALRDHARRPERRASFRPGRHRAPAEAAAAIVAQGYSVMATPSRRTPPELVAAVGEGSAPRRASSGTARATTLRAILALADAILVTGDSANMVGEATATGAPVHIFEPSGGGSRQTRGDDRRAGRASARRADSPGASRPSPMRRSIPARRSRADRTRRFKLIKGII